MSTTRTVKDMIESAIDRATAGRAQPSDAAVTEAAKVIVNQTNNEHWYQSRVTLGSIGGFLASVSIVLQQIASGDYDPNTLVPAVVAIVGAATAFYGRWFAKKALGA